ncbi:MAG: hypothetical protein PHV93_04335 [Candidatus Pacebacteria bacterium]|nr:hypothetical protein [Candidatus Paceibacterota bacterium]
MDQKMQKIIDEMREVKLSPSEKASLKASLFKEIDSKNTLFVPVTVSSPYFAWFHFSKKHFEFVLASVLILVLFGSGVAFAANQSVPGDILYGVKTKVNEKVARLFHKTSLASEALFETHLMDVRLDEAEKLSDSKKLEGSIKEEVRKDVSEQTDRAFEAESALDKEKKNKDENKGSLLIGTATPKNFGNNMNGNGEENNEKLKSSTSTKDNGVPENAEENRSNTIQKVVEKHQKILEELKLNPGESHGEKNGKE